MDARAVLFVRAGPWRWQQRFFATLQIVGTCILGAVLVSVTPTPDEWGWGNADRLAKAAIFATVCLPLLVWGAFRTTNILWDYVAKPVLYTAQVGARYAIETSRWGTHYYVHIREFRFEVPLELYENLREQDTVAVTCKPHVPCLLRLDLVSRGDKWGGVAPTV